MFLNKLYFKVVWEEYSHNLLYEEFFILTECYVREWDRHRGDVIWMCTVVIDWTSLKGVNGYESHIQRKVVKTFSYQSMHKNNFVRTACTITVFYRNGTLIQYSSNLFLFIYLSIYLFIYLAH